MTAKHEQSRHAPLAASARNPRSRFDPLLSPLIAIPAGMFLTVLLAGFRLGEKNLWLDEATSWQFSGRFLQRLPEVPDANMNVYYWLLALWRQLGIGDTEAALRALSVVFAVLTIPAMYGLAHYLFGRRAAAFAALLMASDVLFIRFAQEMRGYSLLVLLSVVSTYLFVIAWRRGGVARWMIYGVVAVISVYNHYFAGFAIAAHGLALLLFERERALRPAPIVAYSLFGVGTLPLAWAISVKGGCQIAWIPSASFELFATEVMEVGGPAGLVTLGIYVALSGLGILLAMRASWSPVRRAIVLMSLWATVPIVGSLLISFVQPVFVLRYLVVALPPFVLLAALVLSRLRVRQVLIGAAALVLAVNVAGVAAWYDRPSEEFWQAATEHVVGASQPGDGIIFYTRSGKKPFAYYARQMDAVDATPIEVWTPKEPCDDVDASQYEAELASIASTASSQYPRIWLVLTHTEVWDPPPDLQQLTAQLVSSYSLASSATFGLNRESGHIIEVRLYRPTAERDLQASLGSQP